MASVSVSPSCFLCSANLLVSSKRRLISPLSSAYAEVHKFVVDIVRPNHCFEGVSYVCRLPCFANLTKAVRHHVALIELMEAFGTPTTKCVTADSTTHTDSCTPHSPHLCVETASTMLNTSVSSSSSLELESDSSEDEMAHVTGMSESTHREVHTPHTHT